MNKLKKFFQKRKGIQIKWKRDKQPSIYERIRSSYSNTDISTDIDNLKQKYVAWKSRRSFESNMEFISGDIFIQIASKFGSVFAGPAMVWSGILRLDDILFYGGWCIAFLCCAVWAATEIYRVHHRK